MRHRLSMKLIRMLLLATLLSGCSATRTLPDYALMLNKVKVKTEGDYPDIRTSSLRSHVRQRTNSKWFSLLKVPLGVYGLAGSDTSVWINRTLRNMGEAPVVFDTLLSRLSCEELQQTLRNMGYLDAQVQLYTERRRKKVDAIYILQPGKPYKLKTVAYDIQDTAVARVLREHGFRPMLKEGMQFSVATLNQERLRITELLQDNGYFRFHKEFIAFLADSSVQRKEINLRLVLQNNKTSETEEAPHVRYTIGSISYGSGLPDDSVIHLRRHVLRENTFLNEGKYYSAAALKNTYNHFGRLGAVRYTNIGFTPATDSDTLRCDIQVQTNKPSTISFQPEGTNTAGDLGAAMSLTYQNRNLFRGSETFSVQLRGAYEAIRELKGYSNQDFIEYSLETKLSFPRFILPFISQKTRRHMLATSELSLLYDTQNRPEFHRRLLSAAWRYKWKPQNHHDSYQFDLLDLNYIFMPWISETFRREYLETTSDYNVILRYNYEDLFIMKMGVGYAYNNGHTAMKANVETAGNILRLGSGALGANRDDNGQYRLFNIAYAQYAKADFEFTRQLLADYHNQIVLHLGIGVAYPYGNSRVLPFEKRYFSGGANSVRGWSVRSLGPGRYKGKDGKINFITQTGDMKLDLNLEYRTYLFWKLNGAVFLDAGNIWTLRSYEGQPDGQFKLKNLISDMAVSYGFGLRLNFDYFILRFDVGMKAVNPAYKDEKDDHYSLLHPQLSRDLAFHFAVGLPF